MCPEIRLPEEGPVRLVEMEERNIFFVFNICSSDPEIPASSENTCCSSWDSVGDRKGSGYPSSWKLIVDPVHGFRSGAGRFATSKNQNHYWKPSLFIFNWKEDASWCTMRNSMECPKKIKNTAAL